MVQLFFWVAFFLTIVSHLGLGATQIRYDRCEKLRLVTLAGTDGCEPHHSPRCATSSVWPGGTQEMPKTRLGLSCRDPRRPGCMQRNQAAHSTDADQQQPYDHFQDVDNGRNGTARLHCHLDNATKKRCWLPVGLHRYRQSSGESV
uniref:Secreted protein n=1 Tax=Rhipicephalus appendiculatus TaxID=34631 RepID=A0A131YKX1_RHIAP